MRSGVTTSRSRWPCAPAGVTLGGTLTVTASGGLATFSGLTINATGGYTLDIDDAASSLSTTASITVILVPAGSEYQVNTYTTSNQINPKVASDSNGDYVVVWQSYGQDGSGYGIYAQQYNAAGVPQGSEFQVNTSTGGNQQNPSVAMDASGDFVVAWETYGYHGSGFGIYAQQYNASGTPYGSQFQVNASTTGIMQNPSVAMDATGDFVVAWQNYANDGSGEYDLYAQQYTAGGAVGQRTAGQHLHDGRAVNPAVAMDAAGDFVVAWQGYGRCRAMASTPSNTPAARPRGTSLVSTAPRQPSSSRRRWPWTRPATSSSLGVPMAADGSGYGVFAQQYTANGGIEGHQFLVNTYTAGNQTAPSMSMDAAGSFIVAWQSSGQDGSGYGIYAQLQRGWHSARKRVRDQRLHDGQSSQPIGGHGFQGRLRRRLAKLWRRHQRVWRVRQSLRPGHDHATSPLNYTAQSGPVAIDAGLTLSDAEIATITSATVTITSRLRQRRRRAGTAFQRNTTAATSRPPSAPSAAAPTLTGTDTVANYEAALAAVTYEDTLDDTTTTPRVISFSVTDGIAPGDAATVTVNPQADVITQFVFSLPSSVTAATNLPSPCWRKTRTILS